MYFSNSIKNLIYNNMVTQNKKTKLLSYFANQIQRELFLFRKLNTGAFEIVPLYLFL